MAVRDFPRRTGSSGDSILDSWIDLLADRIPIDLQIELTSVADGDEVGIFDISASAYRKITKANLVGSPITQVVTQVFTSSGTYTPTSGMKYCWVRCQAPGGGSGGADMGTISGAAGGGGGGEFAEGVFTAAQIGASKTVTIGAVGTAGAAAGGTNGGVGGTTSLVTLLTCIGGSGGIGTGANSGSQAPRLGGIGGTGGTGGDFRVAGGKGNPGIVFVPTGVVGDPLMAGDGGDSVLGRGAKGTTTIDAAGTAGQNYGGGASGATEDDTTGQAGSTGGAGIIVVVEFI